VGGERGGRKRNQPLGNVVMVAIYVLVLPELGGPREKTTKEKETIRGT